MCLQFRHVTVSKVGRVPADKIWTWWEQHVAQFSLRLRKTTALSCFPTPKKKEEYRKERNASFCFLFQPLRTLSFRRELGLGNSMRSRRSVYLFPFFQRLPRALTTQAEALTSTPPFLAWVLLIDRPWPTRWLSPRTRMFDGEVLF